VPEAQAERREDWRLVAGGVAVVVLAVFAVYWRALRGQFLWDDLLVVHRNPLVTGELGLGSIWFRTDFPLSNVAFWLEWLAWGKHPLGYHIVNVLLHAANVVLFWRVLGRLKVPAGWLAAMIFAVHPLCVASVAWIAELKNTQALLFYLLSILWYLRSDQQSKVQSLKSKVRRQESGVGCQESASGDTQDATRTTPEVPAPRTSNFPLRTSKWYWLSLGAFVLALLSKTSTVMLPVVLLGYAWWQRGRVGRLDGLRTSPFFALALAFGLMSVWFQAHGAMAGVPVQNENFWGRLAGAGMALWFYLGKTLLPLHLSMIYPRWEINAAAPGSYLPLLLWCGVLAVCWGGRRSWGRHVLFGLGCFTVTLFPVSGFFDMYFLALSRVSDHFVYLPLTALAALAAAGLSWGLKGRALRLAGGGLVAGLAVLAGLRAPVFVSAEALWRDTLAKNPAAWCAHANLGGILAEQQKYDGAREQLAASLALKPDNAQAHSNLGRVLSLQGKFAEAEGQFQTAVKIKPKDAEIRRSYAAALAEQGRREEAMNQLRELLGLKPDTDARVQLATLLYQAAKYADAVAEYRQVLAARPNQPEALNNLAWLLATSPDSAVRDGAEAVRLAEQSCRLTGYRRAPMIGTLAAAYAEAGRFPEAVAAAQKASELATAAGDQRFAAIIQPLLRLYRAGKPYHEPLR
jgi:Flp pilus assembly protein TadD